MLQPYLTALRLRHHRSRKCTLILFTTFTLALQPPLICSGQSDARPQSPSTEGSPSRTPAVQTQMRNVMYHFTDSASVHIKSLVGELVPVSPAEFPVFDNKDSFRLRIKFADITIAASDLASVLNSYVFARDNSPLTGVSISIENGRMLLKGKLHNVGVIPFEAESFLSPTSDGKLLLRTGKVKALHVPVKGVMNLLGIDIAKLIKNGKLPGVQADGDNLTLDPALIFPAPHMDGRVTATHIEGNTVVLTFGDPRLAALKPVQSGNYMSFRGAQLRFGKLTMSDADLILIDMDPGDPLDFFLNHYNEELGAGYTKITSHYGLRVFLKDYNKLAKSPSSAREPHKSDPATP
jgi:hypothetical protein